MSCSSRTRQKLKKNPNTNNAVKRDPEFFVICSSSSPPLEKEEPQEGGGEEEEEEVKRSNNSYQNLSFEIMEIPNKKEKQIKKKNKEDDLRENGDVGSTCFPAMRINRIIRSEAAEDFRITQESLFLINKATEKFLDKFCEDAYANAAQEKRKAVEYKHLSSAVSKGKRYDFLSDLVPEKIKLEDALSVCLAGM